MSLDGQRENCLILHMLEAGICGTGTEIRESRALAEMFCTGMRNKRLKASMGKGGGLGIFQAQ